MLLKSLVATFFLITAARIPLVFGVVTIGTYPDPVYISETEDVNILLNKVSISTDGTTITVTGDSGDLVVSDDGGTTSSGSVTFTGTGPTEFRLYMNAFPTTLRYDQDPVDYPYTRSFSVSDDVGGTGSISFDIDYVANMNDEEVRDPVVTEIPGGTLSTFATINEQSFTADTPIFSITVEDDDFDDTVSPITSKLQPDFGLFDIRGNCTVTGTRPVYDCGDVFIRNGSDLDYETQDEYIMEVVISDSHTDPPVQILLTVSLNNTADQNPSFETDNLNNTIEIPETNHWDTPLNSTEVVFQVHGVNNEFDYNETDLVFSINNVVQNLNGEDLFEIDNVTGLISRTTAELSFEDYDVNNPVNLELEILLAVISEPTLSSTGTLTVSVTNVCEAPSFTDTGATFLKVRENGPTNGGDLFAGGGANAEVIYGPATSGYDLGIIDPDAPEGGNATAPGHVEKITYTITSFSNSDWFRLDCDGADGDNVTLDTATPETTGNCTIEWVYAGAASDIDFELLNIRPTFTLNVVVTDSCGATDEKLIEIAIDNRNDNSPIFLDVGTYDKTIPENSPRGTYVTTVYAYDPDADPDTTIQFSLRAIVDDNTVQPGNYWFYIETVADGYTYGTQNVGKLYVMYPWDRDTNGDTAVVRVYATDGTPTTDTYVVAGTRTTSYDVTVTYKDVNDNRPVVHTFWNRELPYDESQGFNLSIHFANNVTSSTANDSGINNQFEFGFQAPSEYFDIDRTTGIITKADYILIPYQRYDVFVVSYDLGTNPGTKYSPLAIVRIDSYERTDVHVIFHMDITSAYFRSNKKRFILAMNDVFSTSGWFFRVYGYETGSTGNLEVTLYALTSDITEFVQNLNITKTYVLKDNLIAVTRADTDGTPTTTLTASAGGVLDDFNIVLVQPEYEEPVESEDFWTETEGGIAAIIGIILGSLLLIGAIAALIVWFLTRKSTPAPPKPPPPKPEPVLKQEFRRQGPGPQIVVNDDDDFVARPVRRGGKGMQGWDAVTGRPYRADPVTGERTWVENEGDYY